MNFKRLFVLMVLATSLMIGLMMFSGSNKTRAAGPVCTVPGDYATIQAAVNDPGCLTINVGPGVYNENVTITRSLTLNGAQAGVDARGRAGLESVVNGANPIGANPTISIQAANVTVDGFTIKNSITTSAAIGIAIKPTGTNAVITNNIFDGISTTDTSGNGTAQAIYLENGPDDVSITTNDIRNVLSARSAKGITIGDSTSGNPSLNILIEDNAISNITSTVRGAYGISVNNGSNTGPTATGFTTITIRNNTISNLLGGTGVTCPGTPTPAACGWAHAIGLEGDTPVAIVEDNTISNLVAATPDVIAVYFQDNPSFSSAEVHYNNFNVPATAYGIAVDPTLRNSSGMAVGILAGGPVDGACNWWNSVTGPTAASNPGGTGAQVSPNVTYAPWLIAPAPEGACIGGNVPTTANQCKKDGWMTSVRADGSTFKNQGDCMQYVSAGK
jgi:hypothetical protein